MVFKNYDDDDKRPLPISKNIKGISLFKDEFGVKIIKEFVELRAKTYAYLMDDDTEHKKAKGIKKCIIKRKLTLKNYEDCLFNDTIILKSQQRFKSDCHNVYTEQTNKIALSSKDDKRLQTYPYGTNTFEVYESEMSSKMQMINFDDHANGNKTQHNLKWPHIPDHSYRILITGGSRSGKKKCIIEFNKQPASYR